MTTRLIVLGIAALAITACAPAPYYVEYDPEYSYVEPPPPEVEVIPVAPGPAYVWVPGSWYWTGQTYLWQPGRYAVPPERGHVWVRAGWVHHHDRYYSVPGRWARPGAVPHHQYYPGRRPPPKAYRPR